MATLMSRVRQNIHAFLAENPEIAEVRIRRTPDPPKPQYLDDHGESFHRMPESCPIVNEILAECLPDGPIEMTPELRDKIFNRIYNRVTSPFRDALGEALRDKHQLIRHLNQDRENAAEILDRVLVPKPEEKRGRERVHEYDADSRSQVSVRVDRGRPVGETVEDEEEEPL